MSGGLLRQRFPLREKWFLDVKKRQKFRQELTGFLYLYSFPSLRRFLTGVFQRTASVGCTYAELAALHSIVRKTRPKAVLELGSGISTVIIAHALACNSRGSNPGHLTSMEESESFFADTKELVPENLSRFVDLLRSDVLHQEDSDGSISVQYQGTPMVPYDLVFIDGPQLPDNTPSSKYFDGDALQLSKTVGNAFVALLDGRTSTRKKLSAIEGVGLLQGRSLSLFFFSDTAAVSPGKPTKLPRFFLARSLL